jgi:WD40 repeat protein/serine/threonine protein kinase
LLADQVCTRFEIACKANTLPRLEDFLGDTPELARSVLLRELLVIELAYRRRRGEECRVQEYQTRFPNLDPAWLAGVLGAIPESPATPGQPSPRHSVPGRILEDYEILEEIGRGGMGVVHKARQVSLNRLVALKMLLAGEHAGAEQLARFRSEAESVARLQHPNIVQIHEIGEADGHPFCALEYVAGGSLARYLAGTPQPPQQAAQLVQTLAQAMETAHQAGVVHRDLKPANVLLSRSVGKSGSPSVSKPDSDCTPDSPTDRLADYWTPKITDFGLAKQLDAPAGQTQSGQIVGTPSYMAPEQAAGQVHRVGPATDVYALGAILYECLTGRPPFKATTVVETLIQVRTEEPVPPRQLQSQTPRDLETICLKCLEKEPRRRYATAQALAGDLGRYLRNEPITARPVGSLERLVKWTRRQPAVAALLLLVAMVTVAGLGGILLAYGEARQAEQSARDEAENARRNAEEARENEKQALWQAYLSQIGRIDAQLLAKDHVGAFRALDQTSPERRGWEYGYLRRCAEGTPLVLRGHAGPVTSVCYSPDGTRLASASWDETVKVWDTRSGTEVATLRGHTDKVYCVCYSPDDMRLASASADKTVKVWDALRGTQIATLCGHTGGVNAVCYSPDGNRLVSASDDKTVKIWDAHSGVEIATLRGHPYEVQSVCYSPDGSRLASASQLGMVKVWDARKGTEVATLHREVYSLCYSPDGSRLAGSQGGDTVRVWDARSGTEIATLRGMVNSVCYSPDGTRLAGASADKTAKIWDAQSGTEVATLCGHTQIVRSLCYSPDGARLATASYDWTVKVWDAQGGTEVATLRGHRGQVYSVCVSPDGTRLASASWDQVVKLWDVRSGTEVATLRGHNNLVYSACYSPNGSRLATASADNTVKVWDARSGTEIATLRGHTGNVRSVCYSSDGSRLASASEDRTVKLWDVHSGTVVATLHGHTEEVFSVCYSPDGAHLASASADHTVRVWNTYSAAVVATLRGHTGPVNAVCFSPDGTHLASASGDKTVKLWDIRSGTEVATLRGHSGLGGVNSVCYSPDGSRLASGADDRMVKVWDVHSGTEVTTLRGHTGTAFPVCSVCYSPDGSRLVSSSHDQTVRVWDARHDSEVASLRGHIGEVSSASYSPDGAHLASASADRTVKVWDTSSSTELLTLRDYRGQVVSVSYSPDASRLVLVSLTFSKKPLAVLEKTLIFEPRSGTPLLDEKPPQHVSPNIVSPDGQFVAWPHGTDIGIFRRRPLPGSYDPWAEDWERRQAQVPLWHAKQAEAAKKRGDAFAARFHSHRLAQGDNLRWLAWARLAGGDKNGFLRALRQLQDEHRNIALCEQLSCLLTSGLVAHPLSVTLMRQREQDRAAVLVRAAALLPDSGIQPEELLSLARSGAGPNSPSLASRELLGAALYRADKPAEAVRELDKAVRLHGGAGSLWSRLFLALAHQRLGDAKEAEQWRKKAEKADTWEEGVLQRQLLLELEIATQFAKQ